MAHELQIDPVTKEIPMFFYGKTPWHGLGQKLTEDRPATAVEAIKLAHMGWEVEKYPAYVKIGSRYVPMPGTYGIVRQDTVGKENAADPIQPIVLTTNGKAVADQYVPFQNVEAFSFFDSIVGEGQAIYHTAGILRLGDRTWVLAKLPKSMSILGMDSIDVYLLLTNSHDGTSSILVMLTYTRVVCANTLNWAMRDGIREVKIRHAANAKEKLAKAAELMGIAASEVAAAERVFSDMARVQMNKKKLEDYFSTIYLPPEPNDNGVVPPRTANNYEKRLNMLTGIFERGAGSDLITARGTLWGAFNAVTDYVDHYGRGQNRSARMESVLIGHGDGIKQKAFKVATENFLVA